jgi:hypothetical protein
MTYDAVYAKNQRGNWVFKAMNDRARKIMGEWVGVPCMAKNVFWEGNDGRFEEYIKKLCELGVTTGPALAGEKPKPVETITDEKLKQLTEF